MRRIRGRTGWLAVVAMATAACGNNSTAPLQTGLTIQPAGASGNQQSDTVQQALPAPLRVLVLGSDGQPEQGITVRWGSTSPGASFPRSTSVTDGAGVATNIWTLGRISGAQVSGASLPSGANVTFTATALPDRAANIAFQTGNGIAGGVGTTVQLQAAVSDQYGNRVPRVAVNWTVAAGAAVLGAPTTTTDGAGLATVALTFGNTPGPVTVQAAVTGAGVTLANLTATP
jgi:Big-like domain-containing protein